MNIKTWTELAKYYGSYFGIDENKIKGQRIVDDMYELYFVNQEEEKEMIYIEEKEFVQFNTILSSYGWENVFISKYLSPFNKTPAFILQAEAKDYRIQYHFYIEKNIVVDAYIEYQDIGSLPFREIEFDLRIRIKKIHAFLEGYVYAKYGTKMESEPRLEEFINEIELD